MSALDHPSPMPVPAMASDCRIGVDLGGTKIEVIALDRFGTVLARQRTDSPRGSYENTLTSITEAVRWAEDEAGTLGTVGVGTPGSVSPFTGELRNANSTWLNGRPLRQDLERRLDRPVRIANDANCFALSEAVDGAGKGANVVFGVIVGTGTGAGIVVNGRVLKGANGIAGEWGHNPLPWPLPEEWPGRACYCGRRGCIETFLSVPGMSADHLAATGEVLDARVIGQRAASGEPACAATLDRYTDRMARALAHVINVLDPDVIVLGGGVSRVTSLRDSVVARWTRHVFSDGVNTPLLAAVHGDASGVRGAAWLWD